MSVGNTIIISVCYKGACAVSQNYSPNICCQVGLCICKPGSGCSNALFKRMAETVGKRFRGGGYGHLWEPARRPCLWKSSQRWRSRRCLRMNGVYTSGPILSSSACREPSRELWTRRTCLLACALAHSMRLHLGETDPSKSNWSHNKALLTSILFLTQPLPRVGVETWEHGIETQPQTTA